jgi:hypothetical protein
MSNLDVDALRAKWAEPSLQRIDQNPPLGLIHRQLIQVE